MPAIFYASDGEVAVSDCSLIRNGDFLTGSLTLDLTGLKVKSNQAVVFTPMIVNGTDTLFLNGAGVYGRTRWYQFERAGKNPLSGPGEIAMRSNKAEIVTLSQNVRYMEWMNGARLELRRTDYGCSACGESEETMSDLAGYREVIYQPVFIFEEAVAETVKLRELSGRAYIDFKVNQTNILPDYRNNLKELGKITASIDSVKNDKDITVTSLSIKGTASPEGPYANNERLAKGRTDALKNYVNQLFKFPAGFIKTSYDPEDWSGLREWVVSSNIDNKDGILSIIDSDLKPDAKNTAIQTSFPEQYRFLLDNVYPSLRHSDYKIEYTIRQFGNLEEIAEVMSESPQKLSLNEMYLLANNYDPGSDEYNEVFETAVRLYPGDETANLNAANSAMQRGDLQSAAKYLSKAGDSDKAIYARGVYSALNGDFEQGISLVQQAISMGMEDKEGILEQMKEALRYK
ncbi:MAG: DUF3868 domain-containing protein [Muribaculaceae bacterium]|nr:DUF3868 domain-containing protein [Muribaculaceae bacterium]